MTGAASYIWTLLLTCLLFTSTAGCRHEFVRPYQSRADQGAHDLFRPDLPGSDLDGSPDLLSDAGLAMDSSTCGTRCDDKLSCTDDICRDVGCYNPVKTGYCLVSGYCLTAGAMATNGCLKCDPATSNSGWTPLANGTPCTGGICVAGTCCTGCVNGSVCHAGFAAANCGSAGAACVSCPSGQMCIGGKCTALPCGKITNKGCCQGSTAMYCIAGNLHVLDCTANPSCGWNSSMSYYDCGTSGASAPGGKPPKACP